MKKNVIGLLTILLGSIFYIALVLSGPACAAPSPQYGGILKIGDGNDGVSIGYPAKLAKVISVRQAAPAVETLFRVDATGKPSPWLATGYKENRAAKTITITLRKGVKFHDGTDFNAEAVKWNLDQCLAAKQQGTEQVQSIDVVDNYTVRVNLKEWDTTTVGGMTPTIGIGMMVSPTACKQNGAEWCATHPVGTGPFQFVSWQKDVKTVYKKFPGYWQKGKPYLDGIEYVPIVDALTREMSLKTGQIDIMLTISARGLTDLGKQGNTILRRSMGSGSYGLVPDSANPKSPFADVRVRQAAQCAIDSEGIVKGVFFGLADATNQYAYKEHWAYNKSVTGCTYNPAKARQLLAQAGYPNGFKTKIYTPQGMTDFAMAALGYLREVGIEAELEQLQALGWNQITGPGGKWEGLAVNSASPNPDVVIPLSQKYTGKQFTQMLVPPDYAKAVENALTASDFKSKQKWAREAMKLMADKYYLQIFLYSPSEYAVSKPNVRSTGFMSTPSTVMWTPEDAWLEK
jgi:peptide/nickel transport system substrate-binding protein